MEHKTTMNDPVTPRETARSVGGFPGGGLLNPISANFVDDPTLPTKGAGARTSEREAKRQMRAQAGVIEARPGIIESTNIDPLRHSNEGEHIHYMPDIFLIKQTTAGPK